MSTVPKSYLTPEEYLEAERKADFKSEYYKGATFAVAGATIRHAAIITNLVIKLGLRLKGGSCKVYSTDLRLAVAADGLYTYPDVMVICGGAKTLDKKADTVTNATVIVEVLSESTKNYDRGDKFEQYRNIESLKEYLTVAQNKRHVEHYVRQPGQQWLLTEHSEGSSVISLNSIQNEIPIGSIYDEISFDEA